MYITLCLFIAPLFVLIVSNGHLVLPYPYVISLIVRRTAHLLFRIRRCVVLLQFQVITMNRLFTLILPLPLYGKGIVYVVGGIFEGVEGVVIRVKGDRRVSVCIKGIMAVATAYIHPSLIELIPDTICE